MSKEKAITVFSLKDILLLQRHFVCPDRDNRINQPMNRITDQSSL